MWISDDKRAAINTEVGERKKERECVCMSEREREKERKLTGLT